MSDTNQFGAKETNTTIQSRRGPKGQLPLDAAEGEFLFCLDSHELFMGMGAGTAPVPLAFEGQGDADSIQGVPVDTTAPTDGQALIYNAASGKYVATEASGDATSIQSVPVDATAPTEGQVLVFEATTTETPLYTDNFTTSANPLNPAAWGSTTAGTGGFTKDLKAVGGLCESAGVPGDFAAEKYIGSTIPNDSFVSFKVGVWNIAGSGGSSEIGAALHASANLNNGWFLFVTDNGDGTATVEAYGSTATAYTDIYKGAADPSPVAGDVFTLVVIGAQGWAFKNGVLLGTGSETETPTSGEVVLTITCAADLSISNVACSQFITGSATATGKYIPGTPDADSIQGIPVSPATPTDGELLIYDNTTGAYVPGDPVVSGPDAVNSAPTRPPVQIGAIGVDGTVKRLASTNTGALNTNVTNFPATQPVSGSVSVSNFPATQPVSAASLPLPSGAATSAAQTTANSSLSSLDTKTPTVGQKTMATSTPVVLASDQSAIATSENMRAATTYPAAVTDGQSVVAMADKAGRQVCVANAPRDLIGAAVLSNSSATSAASLIAAGASGVFRDIITLIITNRTSTATIVSLTDGTVTYTFAIAGNGGLVSNFLTPLPATSAATAWTIGNSAAVACDYVAVYANNK